MSQFSQCHSTHGQYRCLYQEGHNDAHIVGNLTWSEAEKINNMKTKISRRIEWDMGHRIPDHQSLCKHPHGHRYVAEVTVEGLVIETEGW